MKTEGNMTQQDLLERGLIVLAWIIATASLILIATCGPSNLTINGDANIITNGGDVVSGNTTGGSGANGECSFELSRPNDSAFALICPLGEVASYSVMCDSGAVEDVIACTGMPVEVDPCIANSVPNTATVQVCGQTETVAMGS